MAEDMSGLKSVMEELVGAIEGFRMAVTGESERSLEEEKAYREDIIRTREATRKNTKATDDNTKAKKLSTIAFTGLKDIAGAAAKELLNVGKEGIKFGQAIGVSATRGVQLEINNRQAVASQLLNFNNDLQVTIEQLKATQQGFSDVFTGAAEGMQISAKGSLEVASSLKKGFKSEFEPTADTFRILTQMGMSTTEQFDAFRKSTGRASLSNNQLTNLYNKNSLSFLLYGNAFSKAAVQAERLGINLASVQGAQEGLVTNLDGTIDTVNQLNQIGANIDFGTLVRIAEQEGPEALMAYIRATVPEQLMQSASVRALFKQLGISVEDYLKSGKKQISAANALEKKMTETATATSTLAGTVTTLARKDQLLTDVLGEMYAAIKKTIGALLILAGSATATAISTALRGAPGGGRTAGTIANTLGKVTAGTAIGVTSAMIGKSLVEQGKEKTGTAIGLLGGAGGGLVLASALAPFTGGTSLALYGGLAAVGGLGAGGYAFFGGRSAREKRALELGMTLEQYDQLNKQNTTLANDMFSSGYGSRVLATPSGMYALNNADDIIAGTNLFPKGSLQMGSNDSELSRKIDRLIDALSNATTTINVGGSTQRIPRMQLVGVYSRNEVV